MKHYLLTRFNYPDSYKHMEQRLWLFDKFTRPSIEAQTSKDFEWLILGKPPLTIPIEGDVEHSFHEVNKGVMGVEYFDYIKKQLTKDDDKVLITRLDNDDMLMPTYIEDMQGIVETPEDKPVIYEFKGYRLDLRNGTFYTDTRHRANVTSPFITLVSPMNQVTSVFCHNHGHMWKYFKLNMFEKRNWVQIIHETNWVLNQGDCADIARRGDLTEDVPNFIRKLMVMEAG